jgi:hydrogenase maturation protease
VTVPSRGDDPPNPPAPPGGVLIAGVGNIFLGDDGFGVEVARRLAQLDLPEGTAVGDYGISGMHLAYDLADGVRTAILVDAVSRGGEPGTVYLLEPDRPAAGDQAMLFDAHGMQPDVVVGMADTLGLLGASVDRFLVVGCEPATVEYGIGLSEPVAAAVDEAIRMVLDLVNGQENGRENGQENREAVADVSGHTG